MLFLDTFTIPLTRALGPRIAIRHPNMAGAFLVFVPVSFVANVPNSSENSGDSTVRYSFEFMSNNNDFGDNSGAAPSAESERLVTR